MKFENAEDAIRETKQSLPVRGAWIEIALAKKSSGAYQRSLPLRGAWIEIIRG